MIKNFKVKNFYSFKNEVSINFDREDKEDIYKNIFFLYGHNASGKTNFLKAFSFLSWFATSSWKSLEADEDIPLDTYKFCKNNDGISSFEIVFSTKNDKTYKYLIELTEKKVIQERLWLQNEKQRTTFSTLFKRVWDSKKEQYNSDYRNFWVSESSLNEMMQNRNNCSVISVLNHIKQKETLPIIDALWSIESNVNLMGKRAYDQLEEIIKVSQFYKRKEEIQKKVINLIKHLDIELDTMEWEQVFHKDDKEKFIYLPKLNHKNSSGEIYNLPFMYESSGTKNLYIILQWIVAVLNQGGMAVLDEIDADLHPLVVRKLLKYFTNPKNNPFGAQLIVSTHSTELMNMLSKENIFFAEKNEELESSIFSLSEIGGVRNTEDFSKKYLSGAYGGIMND